MAGGASVRDNGAGIVRETSLATPMTAPSSACSGGLMRRLLATVTTLTFAVVTVACDRISPRVDVGAPDAADGDGDGVQVFGTADPTITVAAVTSAPLTPPTPTLLEREALHSNDGHTADHRKLGEQQLRDGRTRDAIGAFRKALVFDASADVWASLGDAYLRVGDVSRGLDCLQEAVTVDVHHLAARRLLARHHLSQHAGELARQQAEEWVRLEPASPQARQALGRAFSQLGMWKEAIAEFTLVVAEQPDNAWAHNNLGYAALQIGDHALAVRHLEKILAMRPLEGFMLNNLGVAYERSGRHAEAHAAFAHAAELSPRYAQAALNRDRLQRGLDHAQRLVSAETLLKLRDGETNAFVPLSGEGRIDLPAMPSIDGE
jgi:Flp pilus assembly protein TadD